METNELRFPEDTVLERAEALAATANAEDMKVLSEAIATASRSKNERIKCEDEHTKHECDLVKDDEDSKREKFKLTWGIIRDVGAGILAVAGTALGVYKMVYEHKANKEIVAYENKCRDDRTKYTLQWEDNSIPSSVTSRTVLSDAVKK